MNRLELISRLNSLVQQLHSERDSVEPMQITFEQFDDLAFFASYHFAVELKPLLVNQSIQLDSIVRRCLKRAFSDCKSNITEEIK